MNNINNESQKACIILFHSYIFNINILESKSKGDLRKTG